MQTPGSPTWWPNPFAATAIVEYNQQQVDDPVVATAAAAAEAVVALDLVVEKVSVAVVAAVAESENDSAAGNVVVAAFAIGPAAGTPPETRVAALPEDGYATFPSQVLECCLPCRAADAAAGEPLYRDPTPKPLLLRRW